MGKLKAAIFMFLLLLFCPLVSFGAEVYFKGGLGVSSIENYNRFFKDYPAFIQEDGSVSLNLSVLSLFESKYLYLQGEFFTVSSQSSVYYYTGEVNDYSIYATYLGVSAGIFSQQGEYYFLVGPMFSMKLNELFTAGYENFSTDFLEDFPWWFTVEVGRQFYGKKFLVGIKFLKSLSAVLKPYNGKVAILSFVFSYRFSNNR